MASGDKKASAKVLSLVPAARAPHGSRSLPSDIGHLAAQAELDSLLFPHYLLGRQLALEEVTRELLMLIAPAKRAEMIDRLRFNADQGMTRLTEGVTDPKDEAATCGYVATLIQQGL